MSSWFEIHDSQENNILINGEWHLYVDMKIIQIGLGCTKGLYKGLYTYREPVQKATEHYRVLYYTLRYKLENSNNRGA